MSEENRLIQDAESFVAEGQWQAASKAYEALTAIYPSEPEVYYLHGRVLMEMTQWRAALVQLDRALALSTTEPRYHLSRGDTLQALGSLVEASESYRKALELNPNDCDAMINLGNSLHRQGDLSDALYWYGRALEVDRLSIKAMNNIGKTLQDIGDLQRAKEWYDKALAIDANYAEARFNKAAALLTEGDYLNGWREYEWRFRRNSARRVYPHRLEGERWNGTPFAGKRLLVHCEQGLGDVIQFCRYLLAVKALGGTLILEVHKPLLPLLQGMAAVDKVIHFDPKTPPAVDYDYHIPLMSLPFLLGTTLDSVPKPIPYLQPSEAALSRWQQQSDICRSPEVGIVWAGSATDPNRSCPLEVVKELCTSAKGIRFISLQKELPEGISAEILAAEGITHWGDRLSDFNETAAAISHLDLVISIDTAAAHLAGAMGKPLWLLLPHASDWRWLQKRDDSPWYPTARLFRQHSKGDWKGLLSNLIEALKRQFPSSANPSRTTARPSAVTNYQLSGDQLAKQGNYHGAVKAYEHAVAKQPECAETRFKLAHALHQLNRLDEAVSFYQNAVEIDATLEAAHRNLGLVFHQTGRVQKAIEHYELALKVKPADIELQITLGALYARIKSPQQAEAYYRRAIECEPDNLSAYYNLGNLFLEQGLLTSAAEMLRRVIDRDPNRLNALCNLGRTYHRMGLFQEALHYFERGLTIDPMHPELRFNRAITLLLEGEWKEAWPDYEWRFKCHNRHHIYPHELSGRRWQGESFKGKTLLVHAEQGLGDAIQYVRYMPLVKARGGKVVLETHPSLARLFERIASIDLVVERSSQHAPQVPYDLFVPLCTLSGIFGVTTEDTPPQDAYLSVDSSEIATWRSRLPHDGLNIGVVWAGSDTYPERTCSLSDFSELADLPGINWIGLQKGPAAIQAERPHRPPGMKICNWGESFSDFSETAATISSLDMVISIDTSVAHLAGALGKPVWLLLPNVPDWRWLKNRTTSPWYGRMELFRQRQQGDWHEVMHQIRKKLTSLSGTIAAR